MLDTKKIYGAIFTLTVASWLLGFSIGKLCVRPIEPYQKPSIENSYVATDDFLSLLADDCELETNCEPDIFYPLSYDERLVVECLVEGEAGNQSIKGRKLVAQCIYNACVQDDLVPSEVRIKYGYQGWSEIVSDTSKEAVIAVFDNGELEVEDNILWFYNPKYGNSKFHETQQHIITEEDHKFFAPWN